MKTAPNGTVFMIRPLIWLAAGFAAGLTLWAAVVNVPVPERVTRQHGDQWHCAYDRENGPACDRLKAEKATTNPHLVTDPEILRQLIAPNDD